MFITKGVDTVVLHMPKCGGSSVRWAIIKEYPEYRWSCEHADIKALPDRFKDFRRIGFCRNPVTWYASKYFHAKRREQQGDKDTLSHVSILSENFNRSFKQTLPRLLDVRNYFDMHPQVLFKFKRRLTKLAMSKYLGRIILSYPDISEIKAEDFKDTLYDHWYKTVGLDTAVVYKMDNGRLHKHVNLEFPGVAVGHRNVQKKLVIADEHDLKTIAAIYNADAKYFEIHDYEPRVY